MGRVRRRTAWSDFRTFLRWEFARSDDTRLRAVRAVDTATDPEFQGRGIFTRLTLHGVSELQEEGVAIIFNTPNAKSLPGYLKMGWKVIGRPRVCVMPTRIAVGVVDDGRAHRGQPQPDRDAGRRDARSGVQRRRAR